SNLPAFHPAYCRSVYSFVSTLPDLHCHCHRGLFEKYFLMACYFSRPLWLIPMKSPYYEYKINHSRRRSLGKVVRVQHSVLVHLGHCVDAPAAQTVLDMGFTSPSKLISMKESFSSVLKGLEKPLDLYFKKGFGTCGCDDAQGTEDLIQETAT